MARRAKGRRFRRLLGQRDFLPSEEIGRSIRLSKNFEPRTEDATTASTLLFFEQVIRDEEGAAKLSRLRKILSLLLQLLFVALLSLALSRPYLSRNAGEARRVVVFVDVSASMMVAEEDGTRLEHARSQARNVFRGMSTNDTAMLVAKPRAAKSSIVSIHRID